MRISELKTFVVGNPPPGFGGRYFVFLKLRTDDGIEGVGEVYGVPFGPHVVARMIEDVFGRYVLGADPFRIERLWRGSIPRATASAPDPSLVGILSAIEMACWDIVGKAVGKPVYELLGGRVHEKLRSYTYLYPRGGRRDLRLRRPRARRDPRRRVRRAGFHRGQVRPGRPLHRVRPAPALPRDARAQRALRPPAARGGRLPLRSSVRDPRPAHAGRRDPPRAPARALRPALVRGADAARDARGDGQGRARDHDPDRDRRAAHHQVRVRARARDRRRLDPADGARPGRRPARGQEDRRDGRDPLRPDRAPPLLRPDRGRGQHPARGLHAQLPDPREHPDLGRLPQRDPQDPDPLAGRLRDPPGAPGLGVELDEEVAAAHPYDGDRLHLEMHEGPL